MRVGVGWYSTVRGALLKCMGRGANPVIYEKISHFPGSCGNRYVWRLIV